MWVRRQHTYYTGCRHAAHEDTRKLVCRGRTSQTLPNNWVLQVPLGDIGIAYGQVSRVAAEQLSEQYSEDGRTVRLAIRVQAADADSLAAALKDMSSGKISVTIAQ